MPRYTRKEFGALFGKDHRYVAVYISRNKLVLNDNGEIDTAVQMNQDFLDSMILKMQQKELKSNKKTNPKTTPTPKAPIPNTPKSKRQVLKPQDEKVISDAISRNNLDKQKKELEIEKTQQDIDINAIRLAKLNGEVIPTDLVTQVFAQFSKSLRSTFYEACDNFTVEMAGLYSVNKTDLGKMKEQLIEVVNKAIKDGVEESRNTIDVIVKEYAVNGKFK